MQIPDNIFDWIEKKPFETLTPQQKKEVQTHISAAEYNELHQAATIAAGYMAMPDNTADDGLLAALHTHFDATYPPRQNKLSVLLLWKVAASILLLAVAILGFGLYNATQKATMVSIAPVDTVYVQVTKEIPHEVKIYDTIYIGTKSNAGGSKNRNFGNPKHIPNNALQTQPQQLNSVPFTDKDKPQNTLRGNSFKDDTLARNFGFVSL